MLQYKNCVLVCVSPQQIISFTNVWSWVLFSVLVFNLKVLVSVLVWKVQVLFLVLVLNIWVLFLFLVLKVQVLVLVLDAFESWLHHWFCVFSSTIKWRNAQTKILKGTGNNKSSMATAAILKKKTQKGVYGPIFTDLHQMSMSLSIADLYSADSRSP